MTQLNLRKCYIGKDGIRLIADALVGNTIIESVNVEVNYFSGEAVDDITRMIESMQLKTIFSNFSNGVFDDTDAT